MRARRHDPATSLSASVRASGDVRLPVWCCPGFANTHSHAFHRALRGRTHGRGGTFWTWRDRMYALADKLDPDTYAELATAVYAEMALAGITCVGEFHYLHHGPGGARYGDPNAMGEALREAARAAGVRLTLLDTCYLRGASTCRSRACSAGSTTRTPRAGRPGSSMMDDDEQLPGRPPRCTRCARCPPRSWTSSSRRRSARTGCPGRCTCTSPSSRRRTRPARAPTGARRPSCCPSTACSVRPPPPFTPRTSASTTSRCSGESETAICVCPTTERDLADGIGPARELADAGAPLTLGTDQHVDGRHAGGGAAAWRCTSGCGPASAAGSRVPELRGGDGAERAHGARLARGGSHRRSGALCDLVALRLDTLRTAGALPEQVLLVAAAGDVDTVVVCAGASSSQGGRHVLLGADGGPGVPERLAHAVARAWDEH